MKARGKGNPLWLLMKMKDEFAQAGSGGSEAQPASRRKPRPVRDHKEPSPARTRRKTKPPAEVELTHPERVLFPDAGLTKKDVFAYYQKIAGELLPFLKDRPVTLE